MKPVQVSERPSSAYSSLPKTPVAAIVLMVWDTVINFEDEVYHLNCFLSSETHMVGVGAVLVEVHSSIIGIYAVSDHNTQF